MTDSILNAKVTKKTEVAPGLAIIQVAPVGWELPDFIPGQYGVLGLPGSAPRAGLSDPDEKPPVPDKIIKRAYSIASSSKEKEYLEFYVTMVRSGALTPRLFALEEGDGVFMAEKFKGVFTLKDTPADSNLILIATGTGLAPYMSMARTEARCSGRHFAILHGARHSWDLGYRSELETLARNCDNFAYTPTISHENAIPFFQRKQAPRAGLSDPDEKPPVPDKIIKRAYSIASSSKEKEYLEFYVTMVRSGALTPRLFALEEGDGVFMAEKFKGVFTLKDTPADSNLILIATGTGLAPYMSMARTEARCSGRHFAILHGARHSWDLGYRSELETLARNCDNFAYTPTISRPDEEPEGWTGHAGYAQELWRAGVVEQQWKFAPNPGNTHIFLCGAPGMIESMVEILNNEGYKEHKKRDPGQTHVERFW